MRILPQFFASFLPGVILLLIALIGGSEKANAQSKTDSLLDLLEERPFSGDSGRVDLLNELGSSLYRHYPDSAEEYLLKASKIADRSGYEEGRSVALNLLGIVHYVKSQFKEATEYWEELRELRREQDGDPEDIASVLNNLGLVYNKIGNYKKALRAHQEALAIRERMGKKKKVAQSMNNMGMIHYDLGNLDKAEKYYENALEVYLEEGMERNYGRSYNNLSLVHRDRGDHEKALELGKKAVKADQEADLPRYLANGFLSVGLAFQELEELDSAVYYYKEAKTIYEGIGNQGGIAQALTNIGYIELERGAYRRSIELSRRAFSIAERIGAPDKRKEAAYNIAQASSAIGDTGTAFKYQRLHDQLSDSLLNEEKSKQILGMEMKYESEKRKRELEKEKAKRRKVELQGQKVLFITGGGALLLLLIIVFLVVGNRQKRKANRLLEAQKEELEKKKEEKEVLLREVNHRVKNNLQLINSLLSLQGRRIKDEELKALHIDSQNRIRSMGLLHESIYRAEEWDDTELENFVEQLTHRLKETYGLGRSIELITDMDSKGLGMAHFTPVALILNELISNALKYAFKGREKGTVRVTLKPDNGHHSLEVEDDGVGFSEEGVKEGIGLDIVNSLAEQLGGELDRATGASGTRFKVRFPTPRSKG